MIEQHQRKNSLNTIYFLSHVLHKFKSERERENPKHKQAIPIEIMYFFPFKLLLPHPNIFFQFGLPKEVSESDGKLFFSGAWGQSCIEIKNLFF